MEGPFASFFYGGPSFGPRSFIDPSLLNASELSAKVLPATNRRSARVACPLVQCLWRGKGQSWFSGHGQLYHGKAL